MPGALSAIYSQLAIFIMVILFLLNLKPTEHINY